MWWSTDATTSTWGNPLPYNTKRDEGNQVAQQTGYWNTDRAYKTACVVGVLTVVTDGSNCVGAHLQALGPDGIYSYGHTGSDGSFCLEGAQTVASSITAPGASGSISVRMPASPGSCANPSTCANMGQITVETNAICAAPPPTPTQPPNDNNNNNNGGGGGCNWDAYNSCSQSDLNTMENSCASGDMGSCCSAAENFYNNCWVPYAQACLQDPQYASDVQEVQQAYAELFQECNININ